jgi:hypothetical protein
MSDPIRKDIYVYELTQSNPGYFHVDFKVGDYIINMHAYRTKDGNPAGKLTVDDLFSKDVTTHFVVTNGESIPATPQNLRNLLTLVMNRCIKETK